MIRPKYKATRNDPCPCGSGNKFKRCCIGKMVYQAVDRHQESEGAMEGEIRGDFGVNISDENKAAMQELQDMLAADPADMMARINYANLLANLGWEAEANFHATCANCIRRVIITNHIQVRLPMNHLSKADIDAKNERWRYAEALIHEAGIKLPLSFIQDLAIGEWVFEHAPHRMPGQRWQQQQQGQIVLATQMPRLPQGFPSRN